MSRTPRTKPDDASPWSRDGGELPDADTIERGHDRSTKPRFRFLGSAIVVVVVVAVAGTWADRLERGREFDALTATIDSSQQSVSFAVSQVVSTRDYTMPLLVTSSSASVRAGLAKLIDQAAQRRADDLVSARSQVDGVAIAPWHHAERQARAAYIVYLDARIAAMQSMAAGNGQASGQSAIFAGLQTTAATALDAAAPSSTEAVKAAALFASPPP